nr:retrotransposon protein, putative, Ty1-copia subclass [Tanacetum cinerariifolium]
SVVNNKSKGTGQREVRPVRNNTRRVNHQNFSKMTHPHPKRNFVPITVATKSGQVPVNAAKQNSVASTNTARPKVNTAAIRPNNVVPSGDLTCLFAKATIDESNLWHRRLGHINFKTLNKLVRGNLVRASTMLADSLLPTTFWVEAVNTTCYVQNRVLVTKPHNKTPYELLIGRSSNLEFMRPFGCLVTILNTLDHLGKFDGNQSNGDAGIQTDIHAGEASQENAAVHEYILLPFISSNPPLSSTIQSSDVNAGDQPGDVNAGDIQGDVDEISRNDDVFKNKLDEKGIVIRNKARLVAQANTHEERIDYDEVFAPVARIEAVRLFLAYASFKDIIVYQMDVKSAFLYGKIEKEVYVCQPPGFEDPDFPNKVYKVKKALYSLHQAPRACTQMKTSKPLLKDEDGQEVDVHIYRSMICSLMYLTSLRPDIISAVFGIQKSLPLNWRHTQTVTMQDLVWTRNLQLVDVNSLDVDLYPGSVKSRQWLQTPQLRLSMLLLRVVVDRYSGYIVDYLIKENYALLVLVFQTTPQMVINSPCLTDKKELASPRQMATGKDFSNPLMDDMGDTPVETHQTPIANQPLISKPQKKQKPKRKQRKEAKVSNDKLEDEDHVPTPSSDLQPSGEDRFILNEFMVFCTSLQEQSRSGGLMRLKKIGLGRRVKSPMKKDGLGAQEDASKHRRMIEKIDQNAEIALDDETQGRKNDDEMFGVDDLAGEEVVMETITGVKYSVSLTTDVTEDEVTITQALAELKSTKPKVVVQEQEMSTTIPAAATIVITTALTPRAKEAQESSTKRTTKHLESDISKKQKVDENVEPVIDDFEELRKCIEIVPDDGDEVLIEVTPISSRSPTIIYYKIHKEGKKTYFDIIRADVSAAEGLQLLEEFLLSNG